MMKLATLQWFLIGSMGLLHIPTSFSFYLTIGIFTKKNIVDFDAFHVGIYLYVLGPKLTLFPYNRGWSSTQ